MVLSQRIEPCASPCSTASSTPTTGSFFDDAADVSGRPSVTPRKNHHEQPSPANRRWCARPPRYSADRTIRSHCDDAALCYLGLERIGLTVDDVAALIGSLPAVPFASTN